MLRVKASKWVFSGVMLVILTSIPVGRFVEFFYVSGGSPKSSFLRSAKNLLTTDRYNFVVFLTDDQPDHTLWSMPRVQQILVSPGLRFRNAFMTTPLCCPARASMFAGGFYAQDTGVLINGSLNGGVKNFKDTQTLTGALQRAGYKTGFVGKYLNGYDKLGAYVPPGWNYFVANKKGGQYSDWYSFDIIGRSSAGQAASSGVEEHVEQYVTDFHRDQALRFLRQVGDSPFLLWVSFFAPHTPATPGRGDEKLFSDFVYRDRAYGEADLSDKPIWVQDEAKLYDPDAEDEFHRQQLRSLQAVDRAVDGVLREIERLGKLNNTIVVFTSDNGLLWGEHHLRDKMMPYDESLRVPFVIRVPAMEPRFDRIEDHLIAVNLDLPATIFDFAGISNRTQGLSIRPLVQNPSVPWRDRFFIENYEPTVWAGIRTEAFKYIEHASGEKELYDLNADAYEERNEYDVRRYSETQKALAQQVQSWKGLAIVTQSLPEGVVGSDYAYTLSSWGGKPPFAWSVVGGKLPAGLMLDSRLGKIHGVPKRMGLWKVNIRVMDSSLRAYAGGQRRFVRRFKINVVLRDPHS